MIQRNKRKKKNLKQNNPPKLTIKQTSNKTHKIRRMREKIQRNFPRKFTKRINRIKSHRQSLKNSIKKKLQILALFPLQKDSRQSSQASPVIPKYTSQQNIQKSKQNKSTIATSHSTASKPTNKLQNASKVSPLLLPNDSQSIDKHINLQIKLERMKGKKLLQRPQSHKILEGESQKLKDKLESLREQIKMKKQQKEMNKTMQSMGSFQSNKNSNTQNMSTTNYQQTADKQFQKMMGEAKMETIVAKLKERGVFRIEHLSYLTQQQIDKWKDIPVGYRIKLKKVIEKNRQKYPQQGNIVEQAGENNQKQQRNIEDIIKQRKQQQIYVPLKRSNDEEYEQYSEQINEQEQQKMMQSIMDAIGTQHRQSCMKNSKHSENNHQKKRVHWSRKVDQFQKNHQHVKSYPKQTISKSLFHPPTNQTAISSQTQIGTSKAQFPDYKYCWLCLKKITQQPFKKQQRYFCGASCLSRYQETVSLPSLQGKTRQQIQAPQHHEKQEDYEEQVDLDII